MRAAPDIFEETVNRSAVKFVEAARSFDYLVPELAFISNFSEENTLKYATAITGSFWCPLLALMSPPLTTSYAYNKAERNVISSITVEQKRPDETVFANVDFLIFKAEHKDSGVKLAKAREELKEKIIPYSSMQYGHIRYLPVCAAAGNFMEFGLIDLSDKGYHAIASAVEVSIPQHRAQLFRQSINILRYLRTIIPDIPYNTSQPQYVKVGKLDYRVDFLFKQRTSTDTAPSDLYTVLTQGVTNACRVEILRSNPTLLKISPIGVQIRYDSLPSPSELSCAVLCILRCLADLHRRGFVHRDLRWSNIIRIYAKLESNVNTLTFFVIDFEYGSVTGTVLDLPDHWYACHEKHLHRDRVYLSICKYVITANTFTCTFTCIYAVNIQNKVRLIYSICLPYIHTRRLRVLHPTVLGESHIYHTRHDLVCVALMITEWFVSSKVAIDHLAADFIAYLRSDTATAQGAISHPWLRAVEHILKRDSG